MIYLMLGLLVINTYLIVRRDSEIHSLTDLYVSTQTKIQELSSAVKILEIRSMKHEEWGNEQIILNNKAIQSFQFHIEKKIEASVIDLKFAIQEMDRSFQGQINSLVKIYERSKGVS